MTKQEIKQEVQRWISENGKRSWGLDGEAVIIEVFDWALNDFGNVRLDFSNKHLCIKPIGDNGSNIMTFNLEPLQAFYEPFGKEETKLNGKTFQRSHKINPSESGIKHIKDMIQKSYAKYIENKNN